MCVHNDESFGSIEFYSITAWILSAIGLPIQLLAAYLVFFKTPEKMKTIKLSFLNLIFWNTICDYCLNLLIHPYIFFPTFSGVTAGFLNYIGVSSFIQGLTFPVVMGFSACAILGVFENRYHILVKNVTSSSTPDCCEPIKWLINYSRPLLTFFNYLSVILLMIPIWLQIPNQELGKRYIYEFLSCIPISFYDDLFVLTVDINKPLICLEVMGCLIAFQTLYYFLRVSYFLHYRVTNILSNQTRIYQNKCFYIVTLQLSVPVLMFLVPLVFIYVSIIFSIHNQAFNNLSYLLISMHGMFSTIAIISFHKPYRVALFKGITKNEINTIVSMRSYAFT